MQRQNISNGLPHNKSVKSEKRKSNIADEHV